MARKKVEEIVETVEEVKAIDKTNKDGFTPGQPVSEADYFKHVSAHRNTKKK